MTLPRVSIITPSFNQADYLEWTIRSVLGQEYPDLEYVIVDGGSTDGSLEIIQKYAKRLAWWVSEPDNGQAEAINKGLRRATGEIVAWINSDDMYAPGAIGQAVEAFTRHPLAGMVYGDAVSINAQGRPLNDLTFAEEGVEGLAAFHIICQPAVFLRRATLDTVGYLDPSYHFLLDHQLWLRIAQQTSSHHVPRAWAFARHHPAAKNVAQAAGFGEEAFRILAWMQSQPDLAEIVKRRREVRAAAHRFNARYLLEGGQAGPALRAYFQSLVIHPPTALQEWHRMLFAGLSLVGLGSLGKVYYRAKEKQLPASMRRQNIENVRTLYP